MLKSKPSFTLTRKVAAWLHAFADWLVPPTHVDALLDVARHHVRLVEPTEGVSGEWKRHQVYAKMIKDFPFEPKRNLGLAIERAVQEL